MDFTNDIQTRPIAMWPGPVTPDDKRKGPRYAIRPAQTRHLLRYELDSLCATDIFIQASYRDNQIRIDGMPYAGAKPKHPGIILTYNVKGATYQLPCDTFKSSEQNLRAIVLTLQRLRLIEETGVKTHGRQYQGFKKLTSNKHGFEDPTVVLARHSGIDAKDICNNDKTRRRAYLIACKNTHPDAGGNSEDFKAVQQAAKTLRIREDRRIHHE